MECKEPPQSMHSTCSHSPHHVDIGPSPHRTSPSPAPSKRTWLTFTTCVLGALVLVQALALLGRHGKGALGQLPKALLGLRRHHSHREDTCAAYLNTRLDEEDVFSLVLTADPGDFSGTSEAHYILNNLEDQHAKSKSSTVCGSVYYGKLMGQPVLLATTGIGPSAAALCVLELLKECGYRVTEAVYFGTSGWSPAQGGILNPPDCSAPHVTDKITRLGDVCVSPFSVNWTCKKASWDMQAHGYPNQCFRPEEVPIANADALFGECTFYKDNMEANLRLADAMLKAARNSEMPTRNRGVVKNEHKYWSLMNEAVNATYPMPEPHTPPSLRDYTQCMEVDGQMFYSGVPWELKARDYAAQTITSALGSSSRVVAAGRGLKSGLDHLPQMRKSWTAKDVFAVSAMEGIGIAEAFSKYNALSSTKRPIAYTHVRTASNWIHQSVYQKSPGVWEHYEDLTEDFATGYAYAIATGSSFIMAFYQERCESQVASGALPDHFSCGYVINYK